MATDRCPRRSSYIVKARWDLEVALQEAVRDIRVACNNQADFAGAATLDRLSDYGIIIPLSPQTKRIIELENNQFRSNIKSNAKGVYRTRDKRIFLREDQWCRRTLIHEVLHALSHFAREHNVGTAHFYLRESLNEFMTGYVLWKTVSECYDAWRFKTNEMCKLFAYEIGLRHGMFYVILLNLKKFKSSISEKPVNNGIQYGKTSAII